MRDPRRALPLDPPHPIFGASVVGARRERYIAKSTPTESLLGHASHDTFLPVLPCGSRPLLDRGRGVIDRSTGPAPSGTTQRIRYYFVNDGSSVEHTLMVNPVRQYRWIPDKETKASSGHLGGSALSPRLNRRRCTVDPRWVAVELACGLLVQRLHVDRGADQ